MTTPPANPPSDLADIDWSAPDLRALSPSQRLALVLATLSAMDVQEAAGWSEADLAALAGCSPRTVARLLRVARAKLFRAATRDPLLASRLRR